MLQTPMCGKLDLSSLRFGSWPPVFSESLCPGLLLSSCEAWGLGPTRRVLQSKHSKPAFMGLVSLYFVRFVSGSLPHPEHHGTSAASLVESITEHRSTFYRLRVPNSMLPRRVKSSSRAFWLPGAACRGTVQGLTRPDAPICISILYIYAGLSSGQFCYLVTAELPSENRGAPGPGALEPAAPFLGPPSSKTIYCIS